MNLRLFASLPVLSALIAAGCLPPGGASSGSGLRGPFVLDSTRQLEVQNIGSPVNTAGPELAPAISPDGRTLYVVTNRPKDVAMSGGSTRGTADNLDIWVSTKRSASEATFGTPWNLGTSINTSRNEGAVALSSDGRVVMFTGCDRNDGKGDCDIYETGIVGDQKKETRNLVEINTAGRENHPTVTADRRTLYFTSVRAGSTGGASDADIYVSNRRDDGTWGPAVNLGSAVNSSEAEDSPWIAMGDSVLFFSSRGHGGYGGYDLFVAVRRSDGSWSPARNLGPMFNTTFDERFVSATPDGSAIYFSSQRDDMPHSGDFDIFVARRVERARE